MKYVAETLYSPDVTGSFWNISCKCDNDMPFFCYHTKRERAVIIGGVFDNNVPLSLLFSEKADSWENEMKLFYDTDKVLIFKYMRRDYN